MGRQNFRLIIRTANFIMLLFLIGSAVRMLPVFGADGGGTTPPPCTPKSCTVSCGSAPDCRNCNTYKYSTKPWSVSKSCTGTCGGSGDSCSASGTEYYSCSYDYTAPSFTVTQSNDTSKWRTTPVTITVSSCSDSQSGVSTCPSGTYTASSNNTYSYTASDKVDCENSRTNSVCVPNIDTSKPSITLSASTTSPTNRDVIVTVRVTDIGSGTKSISLDSHTKKDSITNRRDINGNLLNDTSKPYQLYSGSTYYGSQRTWSAGSSGGRTSPGPCDESRGTDDTLYFSVTENGTYTVRATDFMGHDATPVSITISNIDKIQPKFESIVYTPVTSANPERPTDHVNNNQWPGGLRVAVTSADDSNTVNGAYSVSGISEIRYWWSTSSYAINNEPTASSGRNSPAASSMNPYQSGSSVTPEQLCTSNTNTVWYLYIRVKDAAGNETTKVQSYTIMRPHMPKLLPINKANNSSDVQGTSIRIAWDRQGNYDKTVYEIFRAEDAYEYYSDVGASLTTKPAVNMRSILGQTNANDNDYVDGVEYNSSPLDYNRKYHYQIQAKIQSNQLFTSPTGNTYFESGYTGGDVGEVDGLQSSGLYYSVERDAYTKANKPGPLYLDDKTTKNLQFTWNSMDRNPENKTKYRLVKNNAIVATTEEKKLISWSNETDSSGVDSRKIFDKKVFTQLIQQRNASEQASFVYTGAVQEWTAPATGKYLLETWGASGGNDATGIGGNGGYAAGEINLNMGQKLYIYVGGAGKSNTSGAGSGGWNGGGNAGPSGSSGGGGGATDIRKDGQAISNRIIVAGGGGGAGYDGGLGGFGGIGGGLVGGNGKNSITNGATQTSGGISPYGNGSAGQGGNQTGDGGGGGGGYYGGGAGGTTNGAANGNSDSGGGGGSSYVGGVLNGTTTAGVQTGSGYARITRLLIPAAGAKTVSLFEEPKGSLVAGTFAAGGLTRLSAAAGDKFEFSYTGSAQTFTAPVKGKYKLEVWGAQGGEGYNYGAGGRGGYTYGEISLNKDQKLYVFVGGKPINTTYGGWNGGGNGALNGGYGGGWWGGGGGGATDIRTEIGNGTWNNSTGLNSRIIVAGGGGGSGHKGTSGYVGGVGGGLTGGNGGSGTGGTQTSAGGGGGFGYGGSPDSQDHDMGAGGGGWYGGGRSYTSDKGGGGGSSYYGTLSNAGTEPGVREGHGFARITLVSIDAPPQLPTPQPALTPSASTAEYLRDTNPSFTDTTKPLLIAPYVLTLPSSSNNKIVRIKRSADPASWYFAYNDTNVSPNVKYDYRIEAVNGDGLATIGNLSSIGVTASDVLSKTTLPDIFVNAGEITTTVDGTQINTSSTPVHSAQEVTVNFNISITPGPDTYDKYMVYVDLNDNDNQNPYIIAKKSFGLGTIQTSGGIYDEGNKNTDSGLGWIDKTLTTNDTLVHEIINPPKNAVPGNPANNVRVQYTYRFYKKQGESSLGAKLVNRIKVIGVKEEANIKNEAGHIMEPFAPSIGSKPLLHSIDSNTDTSKKQRLTIIPVQ